MPVTKKSANRYSIILQDVFKRNYTAGAAVVNFKREDLVDAARRRKVILPKNIGDLIYSFRYRTPLPSAIMAKAPKGKAWIIRPAGRALYQFAAVDPSSASIAPNPSLAETKIPDATPGIIVRYALNDEQALLAIVRYNRLIDIFTGVSCYSLQSHLRSTVPTMGQVETDEIYVGIDRRGVHFIFPVQAKGGRDVINVVQIEQDFALCREKFPAAVCRPIGAQFVDESLVALFEFEELGGSVRLSAERHYRLTLPDGVSDAELVLYQSRTVAS